MAITKLQAESLNLADDFTFTGTVAGVGITEADQWRLTTNISPSNDLYLDTNMERVDSPFFNKLGTGMSVSSGVWSFPNTGTWSVKTAFQGESYNYGNVVLSVYVATDGSTFSQYYLETRQNPLNNIYVTDYGELILNVNNISNIKIKFRATTGVNGYFYGNTTRNLTYLTFVRLGDNT